MKDGEGRTARESSSCRERKEEDLLPCWILRDRIALQNDSVGFFFFLLVIPAFVDME